ncbi:MAG: precorrin-8X methylmutase [Desulfonatronovibrio sp.]
MNKQAVIVLAHGSRNERARNSFLKMVSIVNKRAGGNVVPAFFSLGQPDLESAVAERISSGYSEITIFPYFLFDGNHVQKDIPAIIEKLGKTYPGVKIRVLSSLEHEPLMPEILFERIWEFSTQDRFQPGQSIENSSLEFIQNVMDAGFNEDQKKIAVRVVHSCADFSLSRSLRFHADAINAGCACLKDDKPLICDVKMVRSALTKCENVLCAIDQRGADKKAVRENTTRSAAGMELLAEHIHGAVVVIGNAPTALWKIIELAEDKGVVPALVVGVPVGFVGAAQSKEALIKSGLVYISNYGPKGGSPAAGAIVNALMKL